MPALAIAAVVSAGAGAYAAKQQKGAAKDAAEAQTQSADMGIAEQQRQFDAVQKLLAPYVNAGTGAVTNQQNLIGLGGNDAQQQAIEQLKKSAQFGQLAQQGENSILQNASATGGLRGGNVQAALAQFRPQLLNQLIQQQFSNLGGIAQLGQASAAGQASAGLQTGSNIANLYGQQGAAQAGQALANGQANANFASGIAGNIGQMAMLKALKVF
jgi:hypothetical protein